MAFQSPKWATAAKAAKGGTVVNVDANRAYADWLALLGVEDPSRATRYDLEVAYQSIKMDCQAAYGRQITVSFHDKGKKWAQSKFPEGKTAALALTRGANGAKARYRAVRGFVPA